MESESNSGAPGCRIDGRAAPESKMDGSERRLSDVTVNHSADAFDDAPAGREVHRTATRGVGGQHRQYRHARVSDAGLAGSGFSSAGRFPAVHARAQSGNASRPPVVIASCLMA